MSNIADNVRGSSYSINISFQNRNQNMYVAAWNECLFWLTRGALVNAWGRSFLVVVRMVP